jgi:hypothetical protein
MTPPSFVKEPLVFGQTTKNFNHWKKTMVNYLNILEVWDIVDKGYIAKYNPISNVLTTESLLDKRANDNAINAILNSVSEGVVLLFDNIITAHEMCNALITRNEGNS